MFGVPILISSSSFSSFSPPSSFTLSFSASSFRAGPTAARVRFISRLCLELRPVLGLGSRSGFASAQALLFSIREVTMAEDILVDDVGLLDVAKVVNFRYEDSAEGLDCVWLVEDIRNAGGGAYGSVDGVEIGSCDGLLQ